MKPTEYRPSSPAAGDGDEPDEWADNKLSNAMAWASQVITPKWCQSPEHWTARLTGYLFTSCPCCLVFRGLVIGSVIGSVATMIVAAIIP